MSGVITNKDAKILWARAAGRCSMPECRRELTLDNSVQTDSVTLGQMCHIVGEKNSKDSPRGVSALPIENRNEYSNLVLMCAHHHTEIDKNETDWPVEVLHKVKADHELWVQERLGGQVRPQDLVYSSLIDTISNVLHLNQWPYFVSHAVRQIVPNRWIEAWELLNECRLSTIWPGAIPDFEQSAKELLKSYTNYIDFFLKFAICEDSGDFYREDTYFKRFHNPDYHFMIERNGLWIRKCYLLLCIFTADVNSFAEQVRKHINPLFFIERGHFLILDELGMHGGGEGYVMLPDKTQMLALLEKMDEKIVAFKEEYKGRNTQL